MLYAAYGSNLHLEQMAQRCPSASPVGIGFLPGYRLLFRGKPGTAFLTVEAMDGRHVPILLWEVFPDDVKALDLYEDWPLVYHRETMLIMTERGPVEAMIYVMNEDFGYGSPTEEYMEICKAGYRCNGFAPALLDQALKESLSI